MIRANEEKYLQKKGISMLPFKKNMQLALFEYFVYIVIHIIYGFYNSGPDSAWFMCLAFIPLLFSCLVFAASNREHLVIRWFYISVIVSGCFLGYYQGTIGMVIFIFMATAVLISMFIIPSLFIEYLFVTSCILISIPFAFQEIVSNLMPIPLYFLYLVIYTVGNISLLMLVQGSEKYRRAMEEKTEEAARAVEVKSNFLANMSHEIRTPMNAIIGMAEMALRGNIPKEEKEYLYQIRASGNSLLSIINDILDFSKAESGKLELVETEYEIMSLANDVVNIINTRIGNKDIELILEVDPSIPRKLWGDDLRLKQVILNLAGNAVKFTREGAVTLRINYYKTDEGMDLYISVRDTGIGIKKEDMDKLFDSFQQVDTKRNRRVEGSGLGLAISKQMIEVMGGQLMVESEYGKGSEFHFMIPQKVVDGTPSAMLKEKKIKVLGFFYNQYVKSAFYNLMSQMGISYKECNRIEQLMNLLPNHYDYIFIEQECFSEMVQNMLESTKETECILVSNLHCMTEENTWFRVLKKPLYCLSVAAVFNHEELEEKLHLDREPAAQFAAPEAKVLIVDDNVINLKVTKGILQPFRMLVDVCTNGREALRLVKTNHYDLILMDHMMPEMDGIEAAHMIRKLEGEYYKKLPIIAFTANVVSGVEEYFLKEGLNDFLAKPLEMTDVSQKLRKWLPREKVLSIEEATALEEREFAKKASLDWDMGIKGIDSRAAIEMIGDKELYLETLSDYYDGIEEKYEKLIRYEAEENLRDYTVEVHGLKGISRMVGAFELGDMAERLEKYGKLGDMASIHKHNPELLACYKELQEALKPYKMEA